MDKKQCALETHNKGFNCAQSVFTALCEDVGINREDALKVSACFGGGMKSGEVCGAVTGALMALGMKYGSTKDYDFDNKKLMGEKTLEFIRRFKEKNGTVLCRELLPDRNKQSEVCPNFITFAVEEAEEMLAE